MAESVAIDGSQMERDMWRPGVNPAEQSQPEQLEHLLGERLPATDLLTADQASQYLLRGVAEIVPDNTDQRRIVAPGQEVTMDLRSPIGRDGSHLLIGVVTQGCADKALGVWLIHDEGSAGPVVMLARPDFRPSRDEIFAGNGTERRMVGGVPLSRYKERPTVTGRAKDVKHPALGPMPPTVSRRQSEYYVDDSGVVHISNIGGSNDIAVLRGPSRAAAVDRHSQARPTSPVQHGVEVEMPAGSRIATETLVQPSNATYAEQIDKIADPSQREKAKQWLAKKAEIEDRLADHRRRQEGFLEEAIRSGVISTEEQLLARREFIERQIARGIQGDHLYSPANEVRYQGWQTYHLTIAPNGDVLIEYDEPDELDFQPGGQPVTPGRYVLHENPFAVR